MADKNLFEYFDTEGEASSTLTLKPVTKTMNIKDYNCSVEIKGSDADGTLTASGRFVVQCKSRAGLGECSPFLIRAVVTSYHSMYNTICEIDYEYIP